MKSQNLQVKDIITLFVAIDDVVEKKRKVGRPSSLADSEMLAILLWTTAFLNLKTIKGIYKFALEYHRKEFPNIPDYSSFVRHCQRMMPLMVQLLGNSFAKDAPIRFADSTMLEVCRKVRAKEHKVCKAVAGWGKNWQGWHYGFKLHASINPEGQFSGVFITPANEHDSQVLPRLVEGGAKIVVGDTTYGARVMKERLWKEQGVFVLAPPHPKQDRKLLSFWQKVLLQARPKIEAVFDILKEHMHLVSSFPRSVMGYLFHYLRILLAYQLRFLSTPN